MPNEVTRLLSPQALTSYPRRVNKWFVPVIVAILLAPACSSAPIEEGLFFPTWDAGGAAPTAIVEGKLVEENRCLFIEAHNERTLVIWEDGMGFDDGRLFATYDTPIASVGDTIHGGGGYFGDQGHLEQLSGQSIPDRCVPDDRNGDAFALIYDVEAGTFQPNY